MTSTPPQTLAIDYSFTHPTPSAIRAAGYAGVLRYVSPTPQKNLSAPERDALWVARLGILLAWESTAARASTGGRAGGEADGVTATQQADALGYPAGAPIFFAVDEDVTWAAVSDYMAGVKAACPYDVRVYGSAAIVDAAWATYAMGWQTEAWSGTTVSEHACLYQRAIPTRAIAGAPPGSYDEDVVLATLRWWTRLGSLAPARLVRAPSEAVQWGRRAFVPIPTWAETLSIAAAGIPVYLWTATAGATRMTVAALREIEQTAHPGTVQYTCYVEAR